MKKKLDIVDTLDYRGFHIDFYNDDYGQQVYTIFEGETLNFGAYNTNYIDDMKYVIDNKLDVITNFKSLRKKEIYGAELRWKNDNAIILTQRGEIKATYNHLNRKTITKDRIKQIITDASKFLKELKLNGKIR